MGMAKVWNDNDYPHQEEFKSENVSIPAHEFVMMDEDEANLFLGKYTPIVKKGDGTNDPRFFKKLRIEPLEKKKASVNPLTFHATGQVAKSLAELKELTRQYEHMLAKDIEAEKSSEALETAERERKKDQDERMDRLEAMILALAEKKTRKKKEEKEEPSDEVDEKVEH